MKLGNTETEANKAAHSRWKFKIHFFNSLTPGMCGSNFKSVIFKLILHYDIISTSHEIASHNWMLQMGQYWLR